MNIEEMASSQSLFSCRIVSIDSYTAPPIKDLDVCYSEFCSSAVERVPVLRIFGATPVGQKSCLHVHGVYPYIYVPYLAPDPNDKYLQQLARSIDHALQVSLGAGSNPTVHVFKIVVVKGIPFYGFHATEELFLKIYLNNPTLIKRLCDLLLAGAIMNQVLQPHEAHIPYVLQFLIDYNLYGMNYINFSAVKFRLGGERSLSQSSAHSSTLLHSPLSPPLLRSVSQNTWDVDTLPSEMVLCVPRSSVCELEVDAVAADILNRQELSLASSGFPGLAAIWEEERQRRQLLNNVLPLTPPPSPDRVPHPTLLPNEQRLRTQFEEIIRERLGLGSDSLMEDRSPPSPVVVQYSQSCDLELHEPIRRELVDDVISSQQDQEEAVVDAEAIQRSMELSQRLSPEAIRRSTDTELLDLMLELAQTPATQQLSQTTSQSVAQNLSTRLRKSHSVTSSGSLFSSSPCSPSERNTNKTNPAGSTGQTGSAGQMTNIEGRNEGLFNLHATPLSLMSDEELFDHTPSPAPLETSMCTQEHKEMDSLASDSTLPQTLSEEGHSVEEPVETNQLQLETDENQHSLEKRLPENGSDSPSPPEEFEDMELIPCAQVLLPSPPEAGHRILGSHIPASPSSKLSPRPEEDSVQLEYDLNISQFEASQNLFFSASPDQPSFPLSNDDDESDDLSALTHVASQVDTIQPAQTFVQNDDVPSTLQFDGSQILPAQLSASQRRHLLGLYSGEDIELLEEGGSEGESEDESVWMSESAWDDIPAPQQSRPVDHAGGSSLKLDDEEFSLTDSIPQLDGSGDMPRKGRKPRSKTLGVRLKRTRQDSQPPEKSSDSTLPDSNTQSSSSDLPSYSNQERTESQQGEMKPSLRKKRPSLSLKKPKSGISHNKPLESSSTSSLQVSLNSGPLAVTLKEQALSGSLKPRVEKLQENKLSEYFRKLKHTASFQSKSENLEDVIFIHEERRRRKKRKGKMPSNWAKKPKRSASYRMMTRSRSISSESEDHTSLMSGLKRYSEEEQLQVAIAESLKMASCTVYDDSMSLVVSIELPLTVLSQDSHSSLSNGPATTSYAGADVLSKLRSPMKDTAELGDIASCEPLLHSPPPDMEETEGPSLSSWLVASPAKEQPIFYHEDTSPKKGVNSATHLMANDESIRVQLHTERGPSSHSLTSSLHVPESYMYVIEEPVTLEAQISCVDITVEENLQRVNSSSALDIPVPNPASLASTSAREDVLNHHLDIAVPNPASLASTSAREDVLNHHLDIAVPNPASLASTSAREDVLNHHLDIAVPNPASLASTSAREDVLNHHLDIAVPNPASLASTSAREDVLNHHLDIAVPNPASLASTSAREDVLNHHLDIAVPNPASLASTSAREDVPNHQSAREESDDSKPPYSHNQLITQALLASKERKRTSREILEYIAMKYPYYSMEDKAWKGSLRGALYRSQCFVVEKENLHHWQYYMHPDYVEELTAQAYNIKKRTRSSPLKRAIVSPSLFHTSSKIDLVVRDQEDLSENLNEELAISYDVILEPDDEESFHLNTDDVMMDLNAADVSSSQESESDFHLALTISEGESDFQTSEPEDITGAESEITVSAEEDSESSEQIALAVTLQSREVNQPVDVHRNQSTELEGTPSEEVGRKVESPVSPKRTQGAILRFPCPPPSMQEVMDTTLVYGLPGALHTKPFYSNPADVQPARDVSGRIVRVPSKMPYELHEFEPSYMKDAGGNAQFSQMGIRQWRTVLSMLSSTNQGTQPVLPPLCHPTGETKPISGHYTAEEHKRDVELRSAFFTTEGSAVRVPVIHPPDPKKVAAWFEQLAHSSRATSDSEKLKEGTGNAKVVDDITLVAMEVSDSALRSEQAICSELKERQTNLEHEDPIPLITPTSSQQLQRQNESSAGNEIAAAASNSLPSLLETMETDLDKPARTRDVGAMSYLPLHSTPMVRGEKEEGGNDSTLEGAVEVTLVGRKGGGNNSTLEGAVEVTLVGRKGGGNDSTLEELTPVGRKEEGNDSTLEELTPVRRKEEGNDSTLEELTPVRRKELGGSKHASERPKLPFTQLKKETSQLEGPSPNNTYGFKISQSALPCDSHEVQYLTSMSVELHMHSRGSLRPDPEFDPVLAIFYYIHNDWPAAGGGGNSHLGVIAMDNVDACSFVASPQKTKKSPAKKSPLSPLKTNKLPSKKSPSKPPAKASTSGSDVPSHGAAAILSDASASVMGEDDDGMKRYLAHCGISSELEVSYASSEIDLFEQFIRLVRRTDPDFLVGYEVTMLSWGYLIARAAALNINLTNELSRMPNLAGVKRRPNPRSPSDLHILGRIVLSVWSVMRKELALNIYTFENVAYHVLHQRIPLYSYQTLTLWYEHRTRLYRYRVVEHYVRRCRGNHELLDKFNVIGRTSEFARLYGIEFENVITRGTQYRVESMLLRLAKPANFVAVSPSVQQRARMAAPESLPLILEPESKFYSDPVLVLDFQSLYPSIIIAYNYCYSTCLGRLKNLTLHGDFPFGTNSLCVPTQVIKNVQQDGVSISPNGVVFVKSHVKRGIMPRMLEEILGTRIMVKNSMKQHKENKALLRMLDARQLGLKMIANVTYGYTAANFSGRMPCVEIADSIVRKARETLERAIRLVSSTPEWRARVVYGDTDSLFVLLKGASKDEAFRIGREITERVTADNPKPVKLKFEKVYLPCILQTKKRYVGFMYETPDQVEPVFDAKGIETVRRDSCPAAAKVLEKSLRLLFTSRDVSKVKSYVQRQCSKLLDGHVNVQDYTFAKKYRGRNSYRPGACVPALELTKRRLAVDRRSEPQARERVPYVVVYGSPGQPLIQLVKTPQELVEYPSLRLNGMYYITKQILPPLDRAFSLLGVDVKQWYAEMPRVLRASQRSPGKKPKGTIGQYFATMHCPVCEQLTVDGVCRACRDNPQKVAVTLNVRIREAERTYHEITELCQNCVGNSDPDHFLACISHDCPIFYRLNRAKDDLNSNESLRDMLHNSIQATIL